ncbi:hypothetical protein DRQ26_00440 [bacterium]|nr:MAG: hypothetical protein DRQ26_00440 [bacterium]
MDKTDNIKNIGLGEAITDYFIVRWIELRHYDGKPYLAMELSCSRGRIKASYWGEDAEKFASKISEGDILKVQARGTDYRGQRWLKIENMRKAKPDEISPQELLPRGKYSPKILWARLKKLINSIKNPYMKQLLEKVFLSDRDFAKKFATYPAAKLWHGAYTTGLLEHTLRVAKLCDVASTFYPDCRRELLITGALLHDVGKVDEITIEGFFDYSTKGRLVGHITLGIMRIERAISEIKNFPPERADEIFHLVVSHHGTGEMGSPVPPKTLEAMILHHADMLDAQSEGIQHIIERDIPRGEDFSEFIKILGRFIYLAGYRND